MAKKYSASENCEVVSVTSFCSKCPLPANNLQPLVEGLRSAYGRILPYIEEKNSSFLPDKCTKTSVVSILHLLHNPTVFGFGAGKEELLANGSKIAVAPPLILLPTGRLNCCNQAVCPGLAIS
jgi:hypothetical protein